MKLPIIKQLSREDIGPAAPDWVEKLIYPINLFMQAIYFGLNKNLTDSNTKTQLKTFTIIGSAIATTNTYSFVTDYQGTPDEVILQKIERGDNQNEIFTVAPFISWNYRNGIFNILAIVGLTTGIQYNISLKLGYN